jgi:hypothetical protein
MILLGKLKWNKLRDKIPCILSMRVEIAYNLAKRVNTC